MREVQEGETSTRDTQDMIAKANPPGDSSFDELQQRIKSAPRAGANAKHLLLQAARTAHVTQRPGSLLPTFNNNANPTLPLSFVDPTSVTPLKPEVVEFSDKTSVLFSPTALAQAVDPSHRAFVNFQLRAKVPIGLRQKVVDRLFGEYLALLCGKANLSSQSDAEARVAVDQLWRKIAASAAKETEIVQLYRDPSVVTSSGYQSKAQRVKATIPDLKSAVKRESRGMSEMQVLSKPSGGMRGNSNNNKNSSLAKKRKATEDISMKPTSIRKGRLTTDDLDDDFF